MFFNKFENRLKRVNNKNDDNEYLRVVRENSKEIRDKCLKYIMVRRTRREIEKYFSKDLERNSIKFPEVLPPQKLIYQMDKKLDKIFMDTVKLITQALTYARYMPLLYLKDQTRLSSLAMQSQKNMGRFMKVLLVKRLESSFYAFKKTIERFIKSYKIFIETYGKGKVYLSKNYSQKILEYLESDNFEEIEKLIEEGKAQEYDASDFNEELIKDLKNDLDILQKIKDMWDQINYDPKLKELIYQFKRDEILKNNKVIIFTESRETAEYLKEQIEANLKEKPLLFTSASSERDRDEVIENFDARAREPKDDYRILISTEVLSEGVNLHRANVVMNYDIPWNPTRLMQRVGRINRVDTKHDKVYTYNFFPSSQADNEIELTEIARSKIEAFFTLLGGDSAILTDGEPVESHELFDKLMSVSTLTGEDESEESELKYLRVIEDIRDNNTDLFNKIKRLPKKARSSKDYESINLDQDETKDLIKPNSLLTFFRKGKLTKFYLSDGTETYELDFITTAKILEASLNEPLGKINLDVYYELLMKNKEAFINATEELDFTLSKKRGKDSSKELLKVLKFLQNNSQKFTDKEEELVTRIINRLNEGAIPQRTIKETLKRIRDLNNEQEDPIKVLNVIKNSIPQVFLSEAFIRPVDDEREKREIILSLYIGGK